MSAATTWSPLCAPVEVRHADGVRVERFGLDRAHIGGTLRLSQLAAPLLGASFAGTHVKALVDDLST